MIVGAVNSRLEAVIRLRIARPAGPAQAVDAVVDTGYNGALALPMAFITSLGLRSAGTRRVILGDSSEAVARVYTAAAEWDGKQRWVRVLAMEGDPLIGTDLLKNHHCEIDFQDGGAVRLTNLSRSP